MNPVLRKIISLFILTVILASACSRDSGPVTESGFYLGTIVKISLYDKVPEGVFTEIFELIAACENRLSRNIPESEISEINRNAGIRAVKISDETFALLEKGIRYSEIPESSFDITIGPPCFSMGDRNRKSRSSGCSGNNEYS